MYRPEGSTTFVEGKSQYCNTVSWKDFQWDVSDTSDSPDQPQKPCQTLAEYVSHPLPRDDWYAVRHFVTAVLLLFRLDVLQFHQMKKRKII